MPWEPDYVSSADFKLFARIDDALDDAQIARAITSASRDVDKYVSWRPNGLGFRRQFGQCAAPEFRYYTPRWDETLIRWVFEIDDLMDVTGLIVEFDTSNNGVFDAVCTDYTLRQRNALQRNRPYTQIAVNNTSAVQPTYFVESARVFAKYGWNAIPESVEQATCLQGHRILKRRLSPFGVTGSTNTGPGSKEKGMQNVKDPDVCELLDEYVRLGWTV